MVLRPPGTGKTHLLCALGNRVVHQGRIVRLYRCSVQVE
ncbi:MAG: hypothetical protein F4183_00135 [Rhodothermaceae bacterium]|nr:hypothetical protein [Rhodothermaceae bacterium]MYF62888.1 hypothetical protein [Rhodothermaceae bacterium]